MFNAWIHRHPIVQAKPGALEASGLNRRSRTMLPCAKIKIPARELLGPIFFFYYVSLRLQYYVLAAPLTGPQSSAARCPGMHVCRRSHLTSRTALQGAPPQKSPVLLLT